MSEVPKYTKYRLPSGVLRKVASYKEAQFGLELPMIEMKLDSEEGLVGTFDRLADFIEANEIVTKDKTHLVRGVMRDNFVKLTSLDDKRNTISEMLDLCNGSNQGLKRLKKIGLGTESQQMKNLDNKMTKGITLIRQSVTGLYEARDVVE